MTSEDQPARQLRALVERDYQRLVGAVAVACGSTEAAEDAVQEALVKALLQLRAGRAIDHLAGWVVAVAVNEVRQRWRRAGAEQRAIGRLGVQTDPADLEAHLDLAAAVAELPMRQRQIVILHYLLGVDVATAARVLSVSEGTVKSGLWRARARLAEQIHDAETEEDRA